MHLCISLYNTSSLTWDFSLFSLCSFISFSPIFFLLLDEITSHQRVVLDVDLETRTVQVGIKPRDGCPTTSREQHYFGVFVHNAHIVMPSIYVGIRGSFHNAASIGYGTDKVELPTIEYVITIAVHCPDRYFEFLM